MTVSFFIHNKNVAFETEYSVILLRILVQLVEVEYSTLIIITFSFVCYYSLLFFSRRPKEWNHIDPLNH